MDCLTARQTLEVARPGSADSALSELPQAELPLSELPQAELAQAAEHVRSCADCQSVLRSREALDRRISRLCRDVPVPAGLKDRLLEGLRAAQAESTDSLAIHPAAEAVVAETRPAAARHVSHVSRRAALRIALAAAGVLLMAGGVWFWTSGPSATVALDDVERQVIGLPGKSSALPEFTGFAGGTALVLPQRMTVPKSLAEAAPRQLAVNGDELAVYYFSIPRGNQPTLEGRLVVFPLAMLKKTAAGPGSLNGSVGYAGGFAKAGWVEGPLVYICYLRGGKDQHRQLEELLLPYITS